MATDLYSGGPLFESGPGHYSDWVFVDVLSPSSQIEDIIASWTTTDPFHIPSKSLFMNTLNIRRCSLSYWQRLKYANKQ